MGSEKFCLRWNDFEKNISTAFRELRDDKDFFDVTLACDDRDQLLAHKVILSACSPFFRSVLRRNPHQHPLLYLKGVKYTDLQSVLNFMYHGEVNVAQDELNSFLAVAEDLRVKGLTQNDQQAESSANTQNSKSSSGGASSNYSSLPKSPAANNKSAARSSSSDLTNAPPAKRARASLPSSSNSAVMSAPPPAVVHPPPPDNDDDDDDIKEVVPVKSEPRDTSSSGGIVANTADMYGGGGGSQSHALAQEEDMSYGQDESYDDYEQYGDGGYGDGSGGGMLDPNNLSGGADGNKVEVVIKEEAPEEEEEEEDNKHPPLLDLNSLSDGLLLPEAELEDKNGSWECRLCFKAIKPLNAAKDHILAHFAIPGGLTCLSCGLTFCSRHLFAAHMTADHKSFKKWS